MKRSSCAHVLIIDIPTLSSSDRIALPHVVPLPLLLRPRGSEIGGIAGRAVFANRQKPTQRSLSLLNTAISSFFLCVQRIVASLHRVFPSIGGRHQSRYTLYCPSCHNCHSTTTLSCLSRPRPSFYPPIGARIRQHGFQSLATQL